ncbi:MAG: ribonuclease P protein component [Clostridiales bacterium]|uniref:Ribonuclease P protein component n=1 Tax=Harryflintia acetispora TaxID=1849041 RepID=A0A9X8UL74_9FIRM|nr:MULTISPECIES: ribonuclease P protein component [Oscillospiraceae]PWM37975.1 MAG: ribonuclease P protein component [Clostridiales bacterium]RGB68949.1 ribonuclease P protein component [Harryflintia acetispora]TCL45194.1 ribonuclease P protein component [Harryflintia acetispora]
MPQTVTLSENRDFKRIYAKGKSRVHALLVTYAMKNRLGIARVGVVSSKKIGKAVSRNRARRVVRAALRECGEIPAGWDVVFVCRVKTVYSKSTRIVPVMKRQLGELLPQAAARMADERTL